MSTSNAPQKKKAGALKLMIFSFMLSFLLLYLTAVILWAIYGYDHALSFFVKVLKLNQISMDGLYGSVLSFEPFQAITSKAHAIVDDAGVSEKAKTLLHAGSNGLKDSLTGYLGEDFIDELTVSGAGFFNELRGLFLKAGWLFILVCNLFFIKAFLVVAAIPLFALLGVVGLVDGLSAREIRRSELGRESSYLFHMLNKWIAKIIGLGLCVWVCIPVAVSPQWFFVPLGLLFSMMLSLSASKFKKYL